MIMERFSLDRRKRRRSPLLRSTEVVRILPRDLSPQTSSASSPVGVRQHKAFTACETCRFKKVKCNEGRPKCTYCVRHGFKCDYADRLRPSHDSNVEQLLERLAQTESRLIQLEAVCSTCDDPEVLSASHWGGIEATDISSQSQSTLSPQSPSWSDYHQSRRSDGGTVSTELPSTGHSSRRETVATLDQDSNFGSVNSHTKELYFGKEPLLCEELRCGFPNVISKYKPSEVGDISRIKQDFLDHVRNLYPVICEGTLCMATDLIQAQGFHENHQSCLVLFIIAVTKAYVNSNDTESGLADYQRAMQLRSQLGSQLTLRYVHILVFTALFLLKKDRILDFAFALHAGSTILHTVLTRDRSHGVERPRHEKNNIRLLFWICHSLERDVNHEIDKTLPHSTLSELEELFPLPLPCEQPENKNLPLHMQIQFTFFLAETSLRAILESILTARELGAHTPNRPDLDQCTSPSRITSSPLVQELRNQLDTWILRLPADLNWSVEPACGVVSAQSTRLKLLYWYARFALHRPLMLRILDDETLQSHLLLWEPFREGLLPALSFIKVFILERPDIDVIMANRIISSIKILKRTSRKAASPTFYGENLPQISQLGVELLHKKFARSSDWVLCNLYNIQR